MRTLASIQRIGSLAPIDGADAIDVATVLGWHVVVKKEEFAVGDLAVYFEIDSLLPMTPSFEFLARNGVSKTDVDGRIVEGYRLRTVKLRGQISQGLCLPVSILPDSVEAVEGVDVSDVIGVVKYERILGQSDDIAFRKGEFPSFIPKTDETRIQSVPQILERYAGTSIYVTEKLDGSSCTVFVQDGELNVCSRSINWLRESGNVYWQAVLATGLDEKRELLGEIALQGEVIGGKIQGNKLGGGTRIAFFSAYNVRTGRYLGFQAFSCLCAELGVRMVPVIVLECWIDGSVDDWVGLATRKSIINPDVWAEGIVIRSIEEINEPLLGGRLSFKAINPEFLLREK